MPEAHDGVPKRRGSARGLVRGGEGKSLDCRHVGSSRERTACNPTNCGITVFLPRDRKRYTPDRHEPRRH
jgi:hypothetical protein